MCIRSGPWCQRSCTCTYGNKKIAATSRRGPIKRVRPARGKSAACELSGGQGKRFANDCRLAAFYFLSRYLGEGALVGKHLGFCCGGIDAGSQDEGHGG